MSEPSENTREHILDVASKEFCDKGFEGSRVDTIADKAECNKATIYYYFDDKLELYTHVLLRPLTTIAHEVKTKLDEDLDTRERLHRQLSAAIDQVQSHPRVSCLLLREILDGGQRLPKSAQQTIKQVWEHFQSELKDCPGTDSKPSLQRIQRTLVGAVLINGVQSGFFKKVTGETSETTVPTNVLADFLVEGLICDIN